MSNLLIPTEDGSLSCRDPETGELYHNRAGAVTEAIENYLRPSFAVDVFRRNGCLNVLDICFGLGYNSWVLLAALAAVAGLSGNVSILAIEADSEILNYLETVLQNPQFESLKGKFEKIPSVGKTLGRFSQNIECNIEIRLCDLRKEVPALTGDFDLIFHDPFSPKRVPELWTIDLFQNYHRLLESKQGKVLTYSSASAVRGAFLECGFELFKTAAVGAKSGGTLACIPGAQLQWEVLSRLSESELMKLSSRSGVPYRDLGGSDSRADILKRRELEQKSHQHVSNNQID